MKNQNQYIKAVYEIWKIKNPQLPENIYYNQIVKNDNKGLKLGLFIYDSKAEIRTFDRCSVNPLGIIINQQL